MKEHFAKNFLQGLTFALLFIGQPVLSNVVIEKNDTLLVREWIHLDPQDDGIAGVSINKAYQLLGDRPSRTVLVAVIDSGFDLDHEDLKDHYWVNIDEISDNGIDDDKNGYIDDVNGWNFIGGKDANVIYDTYEITREYNRLKSKFGTAETGKGKEYQYWLQIKTDFKYLQSEAEMSARKYNVVIDNIPRYYHLIQNYLDQDFLTYEEVFAIESEDSIIMDAQKLIGKLLRYFGNETSLEEMTRVFSSTKENYFIELNYGYNLQFETRDIIGDNYEDKKERYYGNNIVNDYSGLMGGHGTHVSGIIAADRNNNIGAKGIASNVKILPIRTVPNGDERDKDVANSIYYAVDNGANIINMSFGKHYSPERDIVEKAIRYADKKGVLIVHAAGNDHEDMDHVDVFPTRKYIRGKKMAKNMIVVGASSKNMDESLTAKFSNYGKSSVDFFAPGMYVYSTLPENEYKASSGTSMAAPVVSGVAALLMSYFPELTTKEIKEILMESTIKYKGEVYLPGTSELIDFHQLSITGGLVNAYEAVKIAQNKIKLESK